MAAHGLLTFYQRGGEPGRALYLDEGGSHHPPALRFDDGNAVPLSRYGVSLKLSTLLELHGVEYIPRRPIAPAPTPEDVTEILSQVLRDPKLARRLHRRRDWFYKVAEKSSRRTLEKPFRSADFGLALSEPVIPTEERLEGLGRVKTGDAWCRQWFDFLGGQWLEEWVGARVRELVPAADVAVGLNSRRGPAGTPLEVDVGLTRGCRSYFISCTTSGTKGLCKSKLFEIGVRSRHLGGDVARAALVCLADAEKTAELQREITDLWGAPNTPRVFGIEDVRAWAGFGGARPNLEGLRTWMET